MRNVPDKFHFIFLEMGLLKTRMNIVFSTFIYRIRELTLIEDRSVTIEESCTKRLFEPSTCFMSINFWLMPGKARCRLFSHDPKMPQAGAYTYGEPARY
jgi:hypothetical protein